MTEVIGVKFNKVGKVYYFDPKGHKIKQGDGVVVETARGIEFGFVAVTNKEVPDNEIVSPLKPIIRPATKGDYEKLERNKEKEKEAFFKHIQGKTIAVSYDSGFKFNIDYPEVGVLRWTPTTGLSLAPSDNEEYEVAEVGKDIYQINWIEQKGIVISQVINFKTHKVFAYMTWNKEGERGNRASIFHRGTFTIHEANK